MPAQPKYIEAPVQTTPAPYNLLDTIKPRPMPENGGLAGVQYDTDFCGVAQPWVAPCVDPGGDTKDATDGIDQTTGDPIVVYHLSSCRLVGSADREARARRALELGASRALEQGFGEVIADAASTHDLTPGGTAVSAKVGLALLEQYAGENYGGTPVIHMSRAAAILAGANGIIKDVNGHLETLLGSTVVAGAGYGPLQVPSAPAAGAGWAYVTGAVNIFEQDVITSETVLNTPYDNQFYVLAERLYVPTFECIAAAVEINILEA